MNTVAAVGQDKWDLDTPALLLDLAVMARNMETMACFFHDSPVKLRPHVKLHKATPMLAHWQLEGTHTVGLTCAKLSEAETLAAAGIKDILIANEIVGEQKIRRLVNLAGYTDIMVAADNPDNVMALSQAAAAKGVTVRVLVEVDIGHKRCGVPPYEPALELARLVHSSPGLRFAGLTAYDGHCTLQVSAAERPGLSTAANELLAGTRRSC